MTAKASIISAAVTCRRTSVCLRDLTSPDAFSSQVPADLSRFDWTRHHRHRPAHPGRRQCLEHDPSRRLAGYPPRRHPDDGEPLVRPLPRLAARRRRPARPDVRVRGRRQQVSELPARPGLPGLRVQRPGPQLGRLARPAPRRQDGRLPPAADDPAGHPGRDSRPRRTPSRSGTTPTFITTERRKALPDLPVIGALAEQYTTLDRYFCAFAGETYPNRFYQHAAQTDRDHNSERVVHAAHHLGSALADPQLQRHPHRRLLLP